MWRQMALNESQRSKSQTCKLISKSIKVGQVQVENKKEGLANKQTNPTFRNIVHIKTSTTKVCEC